MALRVIDERCRREDGSVVVCLESTDREELTSYAAKNLATKIAGDRYGLFPAAHESDPWPYRPKADGEPAETDKDFDELEQQLKLRGGKLHNWRCDFKMCRSPI